MNAQTEIRELTAQELDQVTGGLNNNESTGRTVFDLVSIGIAIGGILGTIIDWLISD